MASFSGALHRPLSAAAAVAVAAVSSDLSDRFASPKTDFIGQAPTTAVSSIPTTPKESWVSRVSFSGISAASRAQNSAAEAGNRITDFASFSTTLASLPVGPTLREYSKLAISPQSVDVASSNLLSSEEVTYRWHLPKASSYGSSGNPDCSVAKSQMVVVLLGWLGAKQKHLKRYADWYTSKGFHVVTFTLPLADVVRYYKVGGKAEQEIGLLANHLTDFLTEEREKNLIFHTFSNTGWIMYGVILENFQKQDPSLMERIMGCIVDSAPVAAPDPQVWASGFSAAFLKKRSIATKTASPDVTPAVAETALLGVLEKFFEVVLSLPSVNRRLVDVFDLLSSKQPKCPQLYVYSSSDRVIPAKSVETFVEGQRKAGYEVRAFDFVSSPHVDHFRSHPNLYSSQLASFLDDCVLTCCKGCS
ncbi:unnamed protein product [Spirodela intermedia]|uniref:Uncharacterized protein n=1 Tax=Spirodela intermedia TaxID=51605 RepID=A0A7I8J949_SPIIN|nr:unnamed protein product [Spirodela intermedia]CAA6666614.1 unnamed protein product [Spirodela intermedia]